MRTASYSTQELKVSVTEGKYLLQQEDIICLQACSNYTRIYLADQRCILSAKTLKQYERFLSPRQFYRVRSSHVVNTRYIKELADNNEMVLSHQIRVRIAKRRRTALLKWLEEQGVKLHFTSSSLPVL